MQRTLAAQPRTLTRDVSVIAASFAGVRPFPAVVAHVRSLAADPSCAAADVARLLEGDVGLVTDLLRVVNAPASGLAQRCTSVRHAVSLLGLKRVSEVVAGAAALAFIEEATSPHPALAAHAIATAGVARLLAPIIGLSPDEAFTVGLLHDVGALLVVQTNDPFYEELVEQTAFGEEPSVADEQALMGFDHGALGGEVLRKWHVPEPLPQVVTLHHRWEEALAAGGAVAAMVALLRVSDVLVAATGEHPGPRLSDLDVFLEEPAFAYLGLTREEIFNLWPALLRTSDKAFVIGTAAEPPEPTMAPLPTASASASATALAPPPAPSSKLGFWIALGACLATALIGILLYAPT